MKNPEDSYVTIKFMFDSARPDAQEIWMKIADLLVTAAGEDMAREVTDSVIAELERRKAHPGSRRRTITVRRPR